MQSESSFSSSQNQQFKYVRVQRQLINDGDVSRVILKLIDTSSKVLFDREKTEKVIMSMVNATISHELRNPINSIHCQNVTIEMLLKKIDDLLEYESSLTVEQFRE